MTGKDLLLAWREAEKAAFKAEFELYSIGQMAADPRIKELFSQAGELRVDADRQFHYLASVLVLRPKPPL